MTDMLLTRVGGFIIETADGRAVPREVERRTNWSRADRRIYDIVVGHYSDDECPHQLIASFSQGHRKAFTTEVQKVLDSGRMDNPRLLRKCRLWISIQPFK